MVLFPVALIDPLTTPKPSHFLYFCVAFIFWQPVEIDILNFVDRLIAG